MMGPLKGIRIVEIDGVTQPAPAPRFSRTEPEIQGPRPMPGENTEQVLGAWGFSSEEIETLRILGAIGEGGRL